MQMKWCGPFMILVALASVAASSESEMDNALAASDVSLLQASLDVQQPAETLKADPAILAEKEHMSTAEAVAQLERDASEAEDDTSLGRTNGTKQACGNGEVWTHSGCQTAGCNDQYAHCGQVPCYGKHNSLGQQGAQDCCRAYCGSASGLVCYYNEHAEQCYETGRAEGRSGRWYNGYAGNQPAPQEWSSFSPEADSSLCPGGADGCWPHLVFLDSEVSMLESAASHRNFRGKVYVPAMMRTNPPGFARIYEIDVSDSNKRTAPVKSVKVPEINRLHGGNAGITPYGSKLAGDGVFFVLDFQKGGGWLLGVDLSNGNTVTQFRVCQPNDLDIYEDDLVQGQPRDITVFVGQSHRSWAAVQSNKLCDAPAAITVGYGNVLEIKVKENNVYHCGPGSDSDTRCSWANFNAYKDNTHGGPTETNGWRLLGRSSECSGKCMEGQPVGVSYHPQRKEVWTANLLSLERIDRVTGEGIGPIEASNWYWGFESEYSVGEHASDPYMFGALDNTKWLADGNTLIAAIYEAFYYSRGQGVAPFNSGASSSLSEQYGVPGVTEGRGWKTEFNHVVAMAFCTADYSRVVRNEDTKMQPEEVAAITRIFRYNPQADPRINTRQAEYCQDVQFDRLGDGHKTLDAPCFSGRVTHLEPILTADTFVAINYQSKAVLVLKNAGIHRLQCNNWHR
jgi:hypothetical protein